MRMTDEEAHDALAKMAREHVPTAGETLTDDDINSVGDGDGPSPRGAAAMTIEGAGQGATTPQDLAASLRRGRSGVRQMPTMDLSNEPSVDVSIGQPTDLTRKPKTMELPTMDMSKPSPGDMLTENDINSVGDNESTPPGPSSSPRGVMASLAMGAKPTPAASTPTTPHDSELEALQRKGADERRMGEIGKSVTAFTELPTNELDSYRVHGGSWKGLPHNTQWDNAGAEADRGIADLGARRTADAALKSKADAADPNSSTAKVYRDVLSKFMPGTDLSGATSAQMEKIAPWLESYAKDAAAKTKAEAKPDELPSLKANLKAAYPAKAAEIDALGSAKAAEDFRLINEGRLGRDTSIQAARIAADAARGEARTVRGEVKEDKQTEEAAKQALPGYVHDPKVQISPTEAAAVRDGVAEARSMSSLIDELDGMVAKNGIKVWPDSDKVAMQSTMRQLQLKAKGKAFAELGVLSGPDLALLEQLTGDPTDVMTNFKGGAEGVRKRLQVFKGVLNNGVAEKLRSKGYAPEGGASGDGMEHRTLSSGLKAHRKPGGEWEVDDGP